MRAERPIPAAIRSTAAYNNLASIVRLALVSHDIFEGVPGKGLAAID